MAVGEEMNRVCHNSHSHPTYLTKQHDHSPSVPANNRELRYISFLNVLHAQYQKVFLTPPPTFTPIHSILPIFQCYSPCSCHYCSPRLLQVPLEIPVLSFLLSIIRCPNRKSPLCLKLPISPKIPFYDLPCLQDLVQPSRPSFSPSNSNLLPLQGPLNHLFSPSRMLFILIFS